MSCDAHLQTVSASLFKRLILQSGACVGATAPLEIDHTFHRSTFERLIHALSLNSSVDMIESLRTRPYNELVTAMENVENPDGMFCITADHDLRDGFWKVTTECCYRKDILIGNTYHDVITFLVVKTNGLGVCILRLCSQERVSRMSRIDTFAS